MTCQPCYERSVFLSETVLCTHIGPNYHPSRETFFGIDARLGEMHGYEPLLREVLSGLELVVANQRRLERALQAGAIGAWGNRGRD